MKYIRSVNFYLLILGIVGTVAVISYLLHTGKPTLGEWKSNVFHYIWGLLPFLLLLGLNFKKNPSFFQSITIFGIVILQLILAIVAYALAITSGAHPKVSILLTALPLYQLMMSILVLIVYYIPKASEF